MIENIFIVLVAFLLLLACIDLFVGVSNDAVNFLNAAVGSRIAPLQVVLTVASIGVLFGATFSSGMMEVARSGVFHPQLFTFYELMLVFCAVMLTDVLLLNTFNSLGLPTSTTVSIVFELLGASVCASAYKLSEAGISYSEIFEYIKTDRAATIISAILVSVVVAFFAGAIVQFILRLLFSFRFQNAYKYLGGIFCGFSLTAIVYFLVMKGAKGASFMKPEYLAFIDEHTNSLLLAFFIGFTVFSQILVLLKFNVFRIIILAGTFALAFSFAGNDLVNFVGVPLAALDSFLAWSAAGYPDSHGMTMGVLNETARTSTIFLGIAGLIMVITLWTSKKAHRVIQTSINLSSSTQGEHEQFGASTPGRVITRFGLGVARASKNILPNFLLAFIASRYIKPPVVKGERPLPFDYVRASVNLVLAAVLISSATSLKLPLSTTYVTFMVAMGSSFADGAWSRESAVYRISGVITVIAGWFLTAMTAFTAAACVAFLFFNFGFVAIFAMMAIVVFVIVRTNFVKEKKSETVSLVLQAKDDNDKVLDSIAKSVPVYFDAEIEVVERALGNFFGDNEFKLRRDFNKASNIEYDISKVRSEYYSLASSSADSAASKVSTDAKHFFYLTFSNMREASKAVRYMVERAVNHVANRHTIFEGDMQTSLEDILVRLRMISTDLHRMGDDPSSENMESMVKHAKKLNRDIDRAQINLVNIIARQHVSMHSAEMYLAFLQGIRDLSNRYVAVAMQERALAQIVQGHDLDRILNNAQMQSQAFGSVSRNEDTESIITSTVEEDDAAAAAKAYKNAKAKKKAKSKVELLHSAGTSAIAAHEEAPSTQSVEQEAPAQSSGTSATSALDGAHDEAPVVSIAADNKASDDITIKSAAPEAAHVEAHHAQKAQEAIEEAVAEVDAKINAANLGADDTASIKVEALDKASDAEVKADDSSVNSDEATKDK